MATIKPIKHNLASYPSSSDSLYIANLCKKNHHQSTNKNLPSLVITNDGFNAKRLREELKLFAPQLRVSIFADIEVLPYERMSAQKSIIAQRVRTLWEISLKQLDIVIVQANTLLMKLFPPDYLHQRVFIINVGDKLSLEDLKYRLVGSDYTHVTQVLESGEFSIRGGIIDIMPMGSNQLVRVDLFDNEVDTIQIIDSTSREFIASIQHFELMVVREYPTDPDSINKFWTKFNEKFPQHDLPNNKMLPAGSEFYLPLFFDNTVSLFDYLDNTWQIIFYQNINTHLEHSYQEIKRRYDLLHFQYPCLKPTELFISCEMIFQQINQLNSYKISESSNYAKNIQLLPDISVSYNNKSKSDQIDNEHNPFKKFSQFLHKFKGKTILIVESMGRQEIIRQTLISYGITPQIIPSIADLFSYISVSHPMPMATNHESHTPNFFILTATLYNGFIYNDLEDEAAKIKFSAAFITEDSLYYKKTTPSELNNNTFVPIRRKKGLNINPNINSDSMIHDLAEIKVGDFVVHLNHGIGKYLGLSTQQIANIEYEMLEIEYQNEAKLFIPINNLHFISRYSTLDNITIEPSNLGNNQWSKIKQRTQKQVDDIAASLLDLYAKRKLHHGHKFTLPPEYEEFALSFGYEPTIDQESCFSAIITDMLSDKPMDRLICGDVGFGKTEVAIRAAFICAMNGYQTAFLAPTTLLTEQHFQNFNNRFAGYPIKIAEISRFKTKKEIQHTLEMVKSGQIDILIGTHRLLQDDVNFAQLGLVIIDEEHRFGVKQKEKLKQMRSLVDFLAMTATPIPRSLSMALEGLRDFSIIATPPQKRLAVNTIICHDGDEVIREAILREIRRGGQVFFLYNDVASINKMRDRLLMLIPQLQIAIAHGQMNETTLEHTIYDFIRQRYNLLLCSTIIETGIDIANANTMIIYRADKFGLSQLHQLRGRVGRSHHQAYCYLITPENLTKDAALRLDAIKMTTELGSGFNLAVHDLEIRGAGEILGDNQSGNMKEVGITLYTEMLNQAIKKQKYAAEKQRKNSSDVNIESQDSQQKQNPLDNSTAETINTHQWLCEVNLNVTSIITADYCSCVHTRVIFYKQLSSANSVDAINAVYQDIIDRYGMPNDALKYLINSHYLRIKAAPLGVKKLEATDKRIVLNFIDNPPLNPKKIAVTMQKLRSCKFEGKNKFIWTIPSTSINHRINLINQLLDDLS